MKRGMVKLGKTKIAVTPLGFGTLPMGKLQANLNVKEGARIIKYAINQGINFIDTAEMYGTYPQVREAVKGNRERLVIATKSMAAEYKEMEKSIKKALKNIGLDKIDIFHIHAAREREDVFRKREGALSCLVDYKKKGKIKAVGIATHSVQVVRYAAKREDIDIIHPLINKEGLGIIDGKASDMLRAIKFARQKGKGIYTMKMFAGGKLLSSFTASSNYILKREYIDSVVVGMINEKEVDLNLKLFKGEKIDKYEIKNLTQVKRVIVLKFCKGCGECVAICPNQAITKISDKAEINAQNCILCGYCISACPEFVIRMV